MPQIPNKVIVPTAVQNRSRFDLSGDNVTTSDFFRVKPSKIILCRPSDTFDIKSETVIRAQPLAAPVFGRYNHHNRWFWVPMRTLMQGWNEFIQGTPYQSAHTTPRIYINTPFFTYHDISAMFLWSLVDGQPRRHRWCEPAGQDETPDATISWHEDEVDSDNPPTFYSFPAYERVLGVQDGRDEGYHVVNIKFTTEGRAFMDLLQNLGYNPSFLNIIDNYESDPYLSALPLLAYLRVFMDFYCSPQFITDLNGFFQHTTGDIFVEIEDFEEILYTMVPGFSNYDPDYFVSAWENPMAPNDSQAKLTSENIRINDVSLFKAGDDIDYQPGTVVEPENNGTMSVGSYGSLTWYILNMLRSATNYALRNNLAGLKFWDRLKAEYGLVMDYKQKGTSLYLDSYITPIQISEVMSTADTDYATLGDYAGKALGYSSGQTIHFESDQEWGYLICISSITPVNPYPYQGTLRENQQVTMLDFMPAEFDQQGVQPITVNELYSSFFNAVSANNDQANYYDTRTFPGTIFGFVPRGIQYKRGTSQVSGDFRVHSRQSGGFTDAWHSFRVIRPDYDTGFGVVNRLNSFVHDLNFIQGDNSQYDRIFANTNSDYDHFILFHHHEIHATRALKSLSDSIFDDEELQHSSKTEVDYNGQQFN